MVEALLAADLVVVTVDVAELFGTGLRKNSIEPLDLAFSRFLPICSFD
jgi:hypothetical protein